MRSISRFTVLAALLGAGLPAHANPPAPESPLISPYSAPAPVTAVMPPAQETVVITPRASVAAIMHEAGQALLWDGTRGEYVLVRAGDAFQDFRVSVISAEQVVLSRGNQHFILPRTADTSNPDRRGQAGLAVNVPAQADVVDPYATGGSANVPAPAPAIGALPPAAAPSPGGAPVMGMAPVDPYASAAKPPALFSPDELPPASGPAVVDPYAPSPAAPAAPALPSSLLESRVKAMPRKSAEPSAPVASNDTPRVTSMPRPVVQSQNEAASVRDEQHSLSRREFDATISDFNALGRDVKVTQVSDGVRVDEVAAGSLPYRMGVRAGDIVLDVDGKKIRNMNDAAAIYARLMDADRFSVKVKRGTGIITLRYQFTR